MAIFRFAKNLNTYQKILLAKLHWYSIGHEVEEGFLDERLSHYNFPKRLKSMANKGRVYSSSNFADYPHYAFTNQQIEAVNTCIASFRKKGDSFSEMQQIYNVLSSAAISINCALANFEFNEAKRLRRQIDEMASRPENYVLDDCREINNLLALAQSYKLPPAIMKIPFLFLRGVCVFSMLCAILTDVAQVKSAYKETLYSIKKTLIDKLRNICLYKIEFPKTKISNNNICSRGKRDNTTVMRLYFFDENDECAVLRLDLPHSDRNSRDGKIQLHFNVTPTTYKGLNHFVLPSKHVDDELNDVFDDVALYVKETMPDLVEFVDAPNESKTLVEMQKFKLFYRWCCFRINCGSYENVMNKTADMFHLKNDVPDNILSEILKTYSI